MTSSKFEVNLMLRLPVRRASFSLFPLASSCSNDYFCMYVIIDFLANRLVFPNTVTYFILHHGRISFHIVLEIVHKNGRDSG